MDGVGQPVTVPCAGQVGAIPRRYLETGDILIAERNLKQFIVQILFDSDQCCGWTLSPTNKKATPLPRWL